MMSGRTRSTVTWVVVVLVLVAIGVIAVYRQLGTAGGDGNAAPQRDPEVLRQAVASMREGCGSLSATFFQGTAQQTEYWSVRCAGGREYQVAFAANGSTNVLDCDVLARLATRPCFALLQRAP